MPRTFKHKEEAKPTPQRPIIGLVESIDDIRCRHCGEENQVSANYSEVVYGCARVASNDGELDDYDTHDSGDFNISDYACDSCGYTSCDLYNVIFTRDELEEILEDRETEE